MVFTWSENKIPEFNNKWEEDYKVKTTAVLQSVIDKRNDLNLRSIMLLTFFARLGRGCKSCQCVA